MKRFSLIAALFLAGQSFAWAQTTSPKMPVDEITQLITYTDVVEEKGLNKDTLYNRAHRWFKTFYKNPVDAIKKADPEARTIDGGYRFQIQKPDPTAKKQPAPMVNAGLVNYKITVMCKDGRFKYEIKNINWQQASVYPIEKWMDAKAPGYDPAFAGYLKQVDDYMKDLIQSLERAIETEPLKKKEDW
ncbi:MAG: DUF4468 domain-containing protein [Bacteroidia bacterium]|nr:DUF4468 domain-containing protein [Bacteroidia bacterium]